MENKTCMIPPFCGKSILRNTGEEIEIIDADIRYRGERSDDDWVTYIDSNGNEHIKEHLNLQLDFKPVINDTLNKVFDFAKDNKMPTTRNCRIFEVAKEIIIHNGFLDINVIVSKATELVDKIGIETE